MTPKARKLVQAVDALLADTSPDGLAAATAIGKAIGDTAAGALGFLLGQLVSKVGADRADAAVSRLIVGLVHLTGERGPQ